MHSRMKILVLGFVSKSLMNIKHRLRQFLKSMQTVSARDIGVLDLRQVQRHFTGNFGKSHAVPEATKAHRRDASELEQGRNFIQSFSRAAQFLKALPERRDRLIGHPGLVRSRLVPSSIKPSSPGFLIHEQPHLGPDRHAYPRGGSALGWIINTESTRAPKTAGAFSSSFPIFHQSSRRCYRRNRGFQCKCPPVHCETTNIALSRKSGLILSVERELRNRERGLYSGKISRYPIPNNSLVLISNTAGFILKNYRRSTLF